MLVGLLQPRLILWNSMNQKEKRKKIRMDGLFKNRPLSTQIGELCLLCLLLLAVNFLFTFKTVKFHQVIDSFRTYELTMNINVSKKGKTIALTCVIVEREHLTGQSSDWRGYWPFIRQFSSGKFLDLESHEENRNVFQILVLMNLRLKIILNTATREKRTRGSFVYCQCDGNVVLLLSMEALWKRNWKRCWTSWQCRRFNWKIWRTCGCGLLYKWVVKCFPKFVCSGSLTISYFFSYLSS